MKQLNIITKRPASRAVKTHSYEERIYLVKKKGPDLEHVIRHFLDIRFHLNGRTPTAFFANDLTEHISERKMHEYGQDEEAIKAYIYSHKQNSHLNYSNKRVFIAYDRSYFYLNLFKLLVASEYIIQAIRLPKYINRFIDIGCGVGTFSVALNRFNIPNIERYSMTDIGQFQLDIARLMASTFIDRDVSFHKADVLACAHERGMRVGSYWLCANHQIFRARDKDLKHLFQDGIIMVDYLTRLEQFSLRARTVFSPIQIMTIQCELTKEIAHILGKDIVNVHILAAIPR